MRDAEAAFYAADAAELSAAGREGGGGARARSGLDRDPPAASASTPDEAELLALLLAVELDPGLSRVIAYLHDDARLTQPTPWLAARLAGREPSPFVGAEPAALAARGAPRRRRARTR